MIKLIILDVDGCLSDGKLIYSADTIESKNFNVKDGLGITTWLKIGNSVAVITGRNSEIVQKRISELGIPHLFQGIRDKKRVMSELLKTLELHPYEVAAIGDDLNDYSMLKHVGRSFTPHDGATEVSKIVDTVLTKNGGDGAVREMIDILIKENDQTDDFLSVWIKD
jgi:3-deoxy-D-manno-octulosonate 8-phosphate phosphatase (KDO 8-P phosphatase)